MLFQYLVAFDIVGVIAFTVTEWVGHTMEVRRVERIGTMGAAGMFFLLLITIAVMAFLTQ